MAILLNLFGAPGVERDGESAALPFERRAQLLAYLAMKRTWVGRAELATLLWPGQDPKLAFTNLRKTLFRMQSLGWATQLEVAGGALRYEVATDVHAFEAALREGRPGDAVALRRGVLLAGFDDDANAAWSSWLGFERDRLEGAWRAGALARLAGALDPAEGVALSARLLEADCLDEAALRTHMEWLARDGRAAQARLAYREFVARMRAELALEPGAELKALHDSLAPQASPMPPSVAEGDGFVGRATELRRIAELLEQDGCRLLTLVGPGGAGKTRLAQRAFEDLSGAFGEGAAFVALEGARTPEQMGGRIALELGVPLAARADAFARVREFLRDRHALLVLDNLEQLAPHADTLETLLRECPRVKILATSRERLALPQEHLLPVEGLPCPEPEDEDRFEAFDAVRLFVRSARRVEPALVPAAEAAAIVDICRQVEGLPLALELAASWTRVLSCASIAAELRQGTELLHAVDAARPARHASIEVVFDQSWRLLAPVERDVLARLSVFRGGFPVDAARAVAGASLPVLGALADKSLLRKDGGRLSLHPLVQHLAGQRLGEAGALARATHGAHYHRLLAQLRRPVEDGDREALMQVELELENCREAWRLALAHGPAGALARSAATLLHFWDHRYRFGDGLELLRESLEAPIVGADPRLAGQLVAASAHLEYRQDRYADAEATAARALALVGASGDPATTLQCLKVMGGCSLRLGRLDDARRRFREALELAPARVDPHNAAGMLDNLALVEKAQGRYDEALRMSSQSLVQHRALRDVAGVALCLNNLGDLSMARGDYESASGRLLEGLELCERHGLVSTRAILLTNLTILSGKVGDDVAAAAYGERALEGAQAAGSRALEAYLMLERARLALRREHVDDARAELARAVELAIAMGRSSLKLAGACCFAEVLAASGKPDSARRVLRFAIDHPAMGAPERDEARARLDRWGGAETVPAAPFPLGLDDLAHRIVVETPEGHVSLLAALGSA